MSNIGEIVWQNGFKEGYAEGFKIGYEEVVQETIVLNIKSIMENLNFTLQEAMKILEISEYDKYAKLVNC